MPVNQRQDERQVEGSVRDAVLELLTGEAELLDDRQFSQWLSLVTEDFSYRVPLPQVLEDGLGIRYSDEAFLVDETRSSLERLWLTRLEPPLLATAWSEHPPLRTRHFMSTVRVSRVDADSLRVRHNVLLVVHHLDEAPELISARRVDELLTSHGSLFFRRRRVLLDSPVVHTLHLRFII